MTREGRFLMITVANTRQFGNNALIAPRAKPDDGFFDLVLVKPFPFFLYPVFVIRLFLGTLKEGKFTEFIRTNQEVQIESGCKKYHIDGEPKIISGKMTFRMLEKKIRVLRTDFGKKWER